MIIAADHQTYDTSYPKKGEAPGVLYIGRIPHGFYETEMREYLSQFGTVSRLRLSRNRRTGKAKHYGFVEFVSAEVAKIVQETMNNYLLEGHLLQVREVPQEKIHPQLWVGANRTYRPVPVDRLERVAHDKVRLESKAQRIIQTLRNQDTDPRHSLCVRAAPLPAQDARTASKDRSCAPSASRKAKAAHQRVGHRLRFRGICELHLASTWGLCVAWFTTSRPDHDLYVL